MELFARIFKNPMVLGKTQFISYRIMSIFTHICNLKRHLYTYQVLKYVVDFFVTEIIHLRAGDDQYYKAHKNRMFNIGKLMHKRVAWHKRTNTVSDTGALDTPYETSGSPNLINSYRSDEQKCNSKM